MRKVPFHYWLACMFFTLDPGWLTAAQSDTNTLSQEGFRQIFNGRDLTGWDGDMRFWRVENGAIVGETTPGVKTKGSTFLIWTAGELKDFELRLSCRLDGHPNSPNANSGIQYRSERLERIGKYEMTGYQADFDLANRYTGILYEAWGRGVMTNTGETVVIGPPHDNSSRYSRTIIKPAVVDDPGRIRIEPNKWYDYTIVARGYHFVHQINGQVTVDARDEDPQRRRRSGLLGFQIHDGPPMRVDYKNIQLRVLKETEVPSGNVGQRTRLYQRPTSLVKRAAPRGLYTRGTVFTNEGTHEDLALAKPLQREEKSPEPFQDRFDVRGPDTTIVFLGGTSVANQQRFGYLETLLTAQFSNRKIVFRNVGWPADTVFLQQRPRYFLNSVHSSQGLPDHRQRIKADILFVEFGKMESLQGLESVDSFAAEYARTIEHLGEYTKRIVIVTPVPFVSSGPAGHIARARNLTLGKYVRAVRKIAGRRQCLLVDLFAAFDKLNLDALRVSQDGVTLTAEGHWLRAKQICRLLELHAEELPTWSGPEGRLSPSDYENLRQEILINNRLWSRYFRPTNWAFIFGNRQQTEFPKNREQTERVLLGEIDQLIPLIGKTEQAIQAFAKKLN